MDIVWAMFSGLVLWEESKRLFDPKKDHSRSILDLAMKIFGRGIYRTPVKSDELSED